jgi:hypothetical protein
MRKIVKVNCSFCKKELDVDVSHTDKIPEDLDKGMCYGGSVNWFYSGYGSKHDLTRTLLAVCDKCLEDCEYIAVDGIYI